MGDSYAIPTKDERIQTLPLSGIQTHVSNFLAYARAHRKDSFLVTAVGCGLAGYSSQEILPMFVGSPENVFLSAKLVEDSPR